MRTPARLAFVAALSLAACRAGGGSSSIRLFDGHDLAGWHVDVPEADSNPNLPPTFVVHDGLLVSQG